MGNAVSQRNFLNYTRHSFASLFNPYFLHLKIFLAKTNALLSRYILLILLISSVFSLKICDGRKKKEAIQSRKSETIVTRYPFTVPYYLSGRFSRIPL